MANLVKFFVTGLESYHPNYGKLIGTGKNNGIAVYEQILGSKRILTSIKDGEVFKQVTKQKSYGLGELEGMELVTTKARNFVTGNKTTITRGQKVLSESKTQIFRGVERQDGQTGSWDSLTTFKIKTKDHTYVDRTVYENSDITNNQYIRFKKDGDAYINAASRNPITEEVEGFRLPNGSVIPTGEHCALSQSKNNLTYYRNYSEKKMENNLGNAVFNFFNGLVNKLNGIKINQA